LLRLEQVLQHYGINTGNRNMSANAIDDQRKEQKPEAALQVAKFSG
jgi:hypothetical protein